MSRARVAMLQLCDSLFPLGSFAHSDGLESAVAAGQVTSAADLDLWMTAVLTATLVDAEGPALRDAMIAVTDDDPDRLARIDDEIAALRPSASGRDATWTMGTRLLKTWQHVRPSAVLRTALERRVRYTCPVAFGVVCAALDVTREEALEGYFYTRLAATVSAAMRLMSLGQHEAHVLLAHQLEKVPVAASAVARNNNPPRSFTPFMDIASMSHQYVHSRLFRS